ncbi:hypothetical protein ACRAQ6_02095 [Erythrobacter sp. HA6-11]
MSGHQGAAYQSEAAQVLLKNCWAGSANSAFSWRQNRAGPLSGRGPDHRNLRYADPLTVGMRNSLARPQCGEDIDDRYGHLQAQIPQFNANSCHDCEEGFVVALCSDPDKYAVEPMTSQGIKLHSRAPYKIPQDAFNYMFKDFYFKGDGSGVAIDIGPKCYNFTFANGRIADYASVIRDVEFNYLGLLTDISYNCAELQNFVEKNIGTSTVAAHPQANIMGDWHATDTIDGSIVARLRRYEILDSGSQLPSYLPAAPYNPGAADGSSVPRFELSANAGGTITPNGRSEVSIRGRITDRAGNRDWPSFQRFVRNGSDATSDRISESITGTQIVERNGCWNDGSTWRTTLWFADADRVDHTPILIDVTCELSGFDADFLSQHEVANAEATRPTLPLSLEDYSWSSIKSIEAEMAPFALNTASDIPPENYAISESVVRVARLSHGRALPVSVEGGEYRLNGGHWSSEKAFVERGDEIEVRTVSSASPGQTVTAMLSVGNHSAGFSVTTWDRVSLISDRFDTYANGSVLEAQGNYQIVAGSGGAITVSNDGLCTNSRTDWLRHLDNLARVDSLRFTACWAQGGGVRLGLADPDDPVGSHFMLYRRWDGSFRISAGSKTWVYPDCGNREVCVDLVDGSWTVKFDGILQLETRDLAQKLPLALSEKSSVMLMSPSGNGARHMTLQEFSVEHL